MNDKDKVAVTTMISWWESDGHFNMALYALYLQVRADRSKDT